MNFCAVTVLIATLVFNVIDTDAAYQKGVDVAAPSYNNYDQQSAQSLYSQVATGYPSANSQYIRQYVNPPSSSVYGQPYQSDPYQGTYQGSYQTGYPINNGIYPAQENQGFLQTIITTIKNIILRIVSFPFRIFNIIKDVVSTIVGLVSPGFRQANTIGYPLI